MLKALIFDFDGLILDTETPEFIVLQEIYAKYDAELSIEKWGQLVGGHDAVDFDPVADLEKLTDFNIPRERIMKEWRTKADALIASNAILPGVINLLDEAQQRGLGLAIASSSEHWWVDSHLKRLGVFDRFDHIICADDVTHTKPSPELFLLALKKLNVKAKEAVIFEDSPNGVKAANAAGIPVVAVPNPVTDQLSFPEECLRLSSLEKLFFERLLASFTK
ncbi:MAG: HAD family hydrolase [Anaerolineae bacterium]|jgi:putative hydrolase of the HAD superfamily|nr:HAD family hydrolase [Anaerolineae bacterium]MBT3714912.1 HAD family hydrolase [Anaerolineae bacterium]MBT4310286.1 HAD family hydrolase [Anaerolineae bacterium]MBT4460108.1 HAD family hydrolase [Anaerolineae bacterium]MBT4842973.1 HAD family hydrolase [Anaerolineae bacterium]